MRGGVCDCPGPIQITRLYNSAVQRSAVVARSSLAQLMRLLISNHSSY
ncbi:unnamed protein product [Ectocarpus sp. 12 AP-2014]